MSYHSGLIRRKGRAIKFSSFMYKMLIESSTVEVTEENVQNILQEKMSSIANKANVHFGQPYLNTATMAGLYRMMLKELANELGVEFPIKEEKVQSKSPWWLNSIQ